MDATRNRASSHFSYWHFGCCRLPRDCFHNAMVIYSHRWRYDSNSCSLAIHSLTCSTLFRYSTAARIKKKSKSKTTKKKKLFFVLATRRSIIVGRRISSSHFTQRLFYCSFSPFAGSQTRSLIFGVFNRFKTIEKKIKMKNVRKNELKTTVVETETVA